jgi:hypothetical protein
MFEDEDEETNYCSANIVSANGTYSYIRAGRVAKIDAFQLDASPNWFGRF